MKLRWIIGILMFVTAVCCCGCGQYLVNSFTFYPQKGMQVDPERFNAPIQKIFIKTSDKVLISAFYLPGKETKRAILFLHGNAGNASWRLPDAVALWSLGASVLLIDYRGYGLSKGTPSEKGVYLDGQAGLEYLNRHQGFSISKIVIYGRSLGTAVAVEIAQNRRLAGVILVSPLSSGLAVARSRGMGWLAPFIGNPFDSIDKIGNLRAPLLIVHGDKDRILPVSMGRHLYERATVKKTFAQVPGAGHNDLVQREPRSFYTRIGNFLNKVDSD
ncbi:MAG: alpha/beta hydrolase [Deltaproteobacteria bacterium]|nr:alpha/beta hydrolase [Deltaproteobacteria bacterium]